MEYRYFGNSGLKVPALSFGTATFGGNNEFFKRWGTTDKSQAAAMVDICLDHGVNFFDTANVYSLGAAEEILGFALRGKRADSIISTKGSFAMGNGVNDRGASRHHILRQVDASLRRLQTDYIDIYFIHGFDPNTPQEETLSTLDQIVRDGRIRYIGCSNFAAWQLMKSLSFSERAHFARYVVYQGYYSLVGRDYEQELMPLLKDQNMGLMVWSPLGWGRLTGRTDPRSQGGERRMSNGGAQGGPPVSAVLLERVLHVLEELANETGYAVPQIAINWLLAQDTVCNVVIGARTAEQLQSNLGAIGWRLDGSQLGRLNEASHQDKLYPHWVGER